MNPMTPTPLTRDPTNLREVTLSHRDYDPDGERRPVWAALAHLLGDEPAGVDPHAVLPTLAIERDGDDVLRRLAAAGTGTVVYTWDARTGVLLRVVSPKTIVTTWASVWPAAYQPYRDAALTAVPGKYDADILQEPLGAWEVWSWRCLRSTIAELDVLAAGGPLLWEERIGSGPLSYPGQGYAQTLETQRDRLLQELRSFEGEQAFAFWRERAREVVGG